MDRMWSEVMLDLETMSTGSNAAIISIGAVAFNIERNKLGPEFYLNVDLASSVKYGGAIDPSTVMWWMQQSEEARKALLKDGVDISLALNQFSTWLDHMTDGPKIVNMWGNGAGFDNVVLASAYTRLEKKVPWNFRNDRCYRTIKNLYPNIKAPNTGVEHNALDDAKYQATHLINIFNHTKSGE